jgi:uncharacterized protein YcbX
MSLQLTGIWRYPVKSCRGESLARALVEPWGLAGDRRWMVVDAEGKAVTGREYPRLVLVTPRLAGDDHITLAGPDLPELVVPVPSGADLVPVSVWASSLVASLASEEAATWLSKVIGEPVRLVYLDDPARRPVKPEYSLPGDRVSLADAFPLLLTSEDSLAAVNGWIAEGTQAAEGPVPMRRFRPNVVVSGAPAWAEDDWRRLRIGPVTFRSVKGCARCVLTTVDPDTAEKGREPIASLARHRRRDGKVWFGVNLIPDNLTPDSIIRRGDPVEILELSGRNVPARTPQSAWPVAVAMIQASTSASSCQASYRPLRPPCPASISVFSRNGPPLATARSRAVHFAGSWNSTRVSFSEVSAKMAG